MSKPRIQRALAIVMVMSLLVAGVLPSASLAGPASQAEPVYLRLKYATFDPLSDLPDIPSSQVIDAYPGDGSGLYIVQFEGPVQEAWKNELRTLGVRLLDYLSDYAFVAWMDAATRARVEAAAAVRWVGIFQPAYKISPSYDGSGSVRVSLVEGTHLPGIEERLARLDVPEARVAGEQFTLVIGQEDVARLAAMPEVLWIEKWVLPETHNDLASGLMGVADAWAAGLDGSGMMITVADTGIDSGVDSAAAGDMHPDLDNRLAAISSWPMPSVDPYGPGCINNLGANDGAVDLSSGHGTHVIGSVAGNGAASSGQIRGVAPQATLTFQAVEQWVDFGFGCPSDTDGYYLLGIPDDLNQLFQEAYNWGSRIHSNSWGASVAGEYTERSQDVDEFVWNHPDMTVLFSAGNAGIDANWDGYVDEDSIGSPGTAKNAITSGASDNERSSGGLNPGGPCSTWFGCWGYNFPSEPTKSDLISDSRQELAAFSSRGPTDDGRIKPDLVAPGTNVLSTRSQSASGTLWGTYTLNSYYVYSGGTSMSNPLIAGAAALVRQYYVETRGHATPSAALIKATLINSAVDIGGYGFSGQEAGLPIPNNHEGWGMVNVGAATTGARAFYDGDTVTTGTNQTYTFDIGSSNVPFKVSLVWSDYPASTAAWQALVNDLDLVLVGPGGITYRGNVFGSGWSVTGGGADTANNVENVYVLRPSPGTWTVRVEGANVPQGPQPFALVATGQFGPAPVYDNYLHLPLVAR
jgi:serine protease AprX